MDNRTHQITFTQNASYGVKVSPKYKWLYRCSTCGADDYASTLKNVRAVAEADHEFAQYDMKVA